MLLAKEVRPVNNSRRATLLSKGNKSHRGRGCVTVLPWFRYIPLPKLSGLRECHSIEDVP
jgi:hypothetical protein